MKSVEKEFTYASSELAGMGEARNYYSMILEQFRPFLGAGIIEVGAGIGTFSEYLLQARPTARLTLVEPDRENSRRLSDRFGADPRVAVIHGYLESLGRDSAFDSMVLINVLEHIADDLTFLRAAYRALQPGGHLLLFVPAVPQIYGSLDREFEHFRRYTRPGLRDALSSSGFRIEQLRFTNFPGVLSWFLVGRVLRKRVLHPRDIRLYDRFVIPWVARLEKLWPPPIGQSLVCVATRPRSGATGAPEGQGTGRRGG